MRVIYQTPLADLPQLGAHVILVPSRHGDLQRRRALFYHTRRHTDSRQKPPRTRSISIAISVIVRILPGLKVPSTKPFITPTS